MLFSPLPAPDAMHIPDGFLSVTVSIIFWIAAIAFLTMAIQKTQHTLTERDIPLMGVLAAAIFAGQMLNFTVAGGTSGHLLGAALATILLGPWPSILVMTIVVSVQAIFFQDGGLLVLGANIFNMAVVGSFVSYALYTVVLKILKNQSMQTLIGGFLAAWGSILIASLACALQLAISGTAPANIAIPAMASIHAVIGVGEGLITLGALTFILAAREELLQTEGTKEAGNRGIVASGMLISLILVIISPLASSHPDGLEWVAERHGFLETARDSFYQIIPEYSMPGISNSALATIIAGIVGILIVFAIAFFVGRAEKQTPAK